MAVAEHEMTAAAEVIALDRIRITGNVRSTLGDVDSLAGSISRHGVLTAITVTRRDDGEYDLVAGLRRVAAARIAGLEEIPAVVRIASDAAETLRRRLAENVDREGLADIDTGQAIQQLLELGVSVDEVATTVRTRPENVEAWADLLRLPKRIRSRIGRGTLSAEETYPLVRLLDDPQSMRSAIKHIDDGWPVDRAVTVVSRDRERERALAAARERLEAEGCPIIDAPRWGQFAGNSKTQKLGKTPGYVNVALRRHAELPCHAAYISPYDDSDVVYCCTDRQTHSSEEGSGVPDLRAERAARRTEKKALRAAQATRFTTLSDALRNHAITTEEATNHILRIALGDAPYKNVDGACALLGLTEAEDGRTRDPLMAHASRDAQSLLDVVLAIALSRGERALAVDDWDFRGEILGAHVALIRATGVHEFSEEEERLIAERSPRRWEHGGVDPVTDDDNAGVDGELAKGEMVDEGAA